MFHDHITGDVLVGFPEPNSCPFCGPSCVGGIVAMVGDHAVQLHQAICDGCGAMGPAAVSQHEAELAWNRRDSAGSANFVDVRPQAGAAYAD